MRILGRTQLTTAVLAFSLVFGFGSLGVAPAFAQDALATGPVVAALADVNSGDTHYIDEDEEDYQACATLIGEGELCGWPQVDLPEIEPSETEPAPGDGQDAGDPSQDDAAPPPDEICPASAEAALPCLSEGEDGEQGVPQVPGQQVDPKCPVPVGDGVICTGPTPIDLPPQSNAPWNNVDDGDTGDEDRPGIGEPVDPDPDGQQHDEDSPGVTEPETDDVAPEPEDMIPQEPIADGTENLDGENAENCDAPGAEQVLDCGPEMPAAGQDLPVTLVFVPWVNGQP